MVERSIGIIETKDRAQGCALEVAKRFTNISIDSKVVPAPFWMNNDPDWKDTRWFFTVPRGGKLTPEEIRDKTLKAAGDAGFDIHNGTVDELRGFMRDNGIGVDCSGLTYQICEGIYKGIGGVSFTEEIIDVNGEHRGITRVNSYCLTSDINAFPIESVLELRPGDLIRCHRGHHTITILEVAERGDSFRLKCVHSSDGVPALGVSMFEIDVVNPEEDIFHQRWSEVNIDGIPYNLSLLAKSDEKDGLYRLRALDEIFNLLSPRS